MPVPLSASRILALAVAVATFVVDQASKLAFLAASGGLAAWSAPGATVPGGRAITVLPFLDLTLVWNRGISYGLLQQDSDVGRWLLVGVALAASLGLGLWAARTPSRFLAAGLGLVIGGALANALDRVLYGAVLDFIHVHWAPVGFSWYVFNVADAAIVVGVGVLLLDSLRAGRSVAAKEPSE